MRGLSEFRAREALQTQAPAFPVPGAPPWLDACLRRALRSEPGERHATAAEFLSAIEAPRPQAPGIGPATDLLPRTRVGGWVDFLGRDHEGLRGAEIHRLPEELLNVTHATRLLVIGMLVLVGIIAAPGIAEAAGVDLGPLAVTSDALAESCIGVHLPDGTCIGFWER